jgi:hypothetical protein
MIEYEQTDGCGSVRVKTTEGFAVLSFACSNPTRPLSLQCRVSAGSSSHLAGVIVENLVERYCPSVLVVEGDNTQLRYKPKIAQMFRCWTQDSQSVYAEAFSSRDLFNRVCSMSAAMQKYDLVRVQNEDIQFFKSRDVLKKIRENTMPFEFLSIKEECDYSIRSSCVNCVRDIISTATAALPLLSEKKQQPFIQAIALLEAKQQEGGRGFDVKHSYIQEAANAILLPCIVQFGNTHPFTQRIFAEFSKTTSKYIAASQEFMDNHAEILDSDS